jgi:hypothetical protein
VSALSAPEVRWFRRDQDRLTLSVHAMPGARRTEIQGLHGDALKIRVAAPPVDGAANDELRKFLASTFAVPLRNIELISGASSRSKRFSVQGSSINPLSLIATIAQQ